MRKTGKIKEYDGYSGVIVDADKNTYLLLENDVLDKDLKTGDIVTFEPEVYKTLEIIENVARFVRKNKK